MENDAQATWGGRFKEAPDTLMILYSESVSFDQRLWPYDIRGSKAHAAMLAHVGLLAPEEAQAIHDGLDELARDIREGHFTWKVELEDVHMNIEQALTERVPVAAKLHTARSRNDQIATDMRLFFKDACTELRHNLRGLVAALLDLATGHAEVMIPGYTHLQRAQPVSMAHHLLAYVEMFARDAGRLRTVHDAANWCPLGSGALAGSTLPIDREFVARELGFVDEAGNPQVTPNSMDAVADRDLFLDFAHACATLGTHFSRVAEDWILWSSTEFGFIVVGDAFATGSSLMPQKKNPDALELLRGKAARLIGHTQALYTMVKGLPLTYNRDLQEDKPPVFDAFEQALMSLQILSGVTATLAVRPEACARAVADPLLLATDLVDYLVVRGVPFRQAHHLIGRLVAMAEEQQVPLTGLDTTDVQALDPHFDEDWKEVFSLERARALREKPGMPGPQQVAARIEHWRRQLDDRLL